MSSAFNSFRDGNLSVNEFVVLTIVNARADENGRCNASAPEISEVLNGDLSRHAVRRALINLEKDKWLTWETKGRNSTIVVN